MALCFIICAILMIILLPLHYLSVERYRIKKLLGNKAERIGDAISFIFGWRFFISWIGLWICPQPKFDISEVISILDIKIQIIGFEIPLIHLVIGLPFLTVGAILGLLGVHALSLKVSESLKTNKLVTDGVYSIVRHPQYLGGFLSHIGIVFLLSDFYAFLLTPLILIELYIMAINEEKALLNKFGDAYLKYKEKVPMFIPRFKRRS